MANYTLRLNGPFERTDKPRDHTRNFVELFFNNAELPREEQEITVLIDYFNLLLAERKLCWYECSTSPPKGRGENYVFRVTKVSHHLSRQGLEHKVLAHYQIQVGEGD